jgi:hypothetical protein
MCEFKIGDKIYKKGMKPIKYTIMKIEEIIGGNWHDGFSTEHYAELDDGTNFKLCYTSHMNQIFMVYALKSVV